MNAELEALKSLYIRKLCDLYEIETGQRIMLWEMAAAAQGVMVKNALQQHLEKTNQHVRRLKCVFGILGIRYGGSPILTADDDTITSLTSFTLAARNEWARSEMRLISEARKIKHYEISGYLFVLNCARILHDYVVADLLEQTLNEEYDADHLLVRLSAPNWAWDRASPAIP